ncbi:glycoside hydrolase family 3 N-terminal domain-containing protein [Spirilliplanes yamanashiensis]|uniref:beta-glucosidase n=1 Tax=Spirilliplanes yamanashiensis TaxID=42233 RepID=A0A8J4DH70_9ACTN|nr:glycoside hydrolase family 3 N-terminal domain-containing protein [Spirilliplanes yamanashiensis]MDP9819532.1 beta-glucosidase-like glycosyl hydrolase [Spirilliplanes yamanashiensis]GIJ01646.1 hypothetical protein Sya03_09980 [Spirilliplanes yamanashiensis]
MATAKHYVGDGGTTGGTTGGDDQGDTDITLDELRALHLPPFAEAVRRGVASVMVSYPSFRGDNMHGHRYLISDVRLLAARRARIRERRRRHADDHRGVPGGHPAAAPEVQAGRVPEDRIDDAVRWILTRKFAFGLFERPFAGPGGDFVNLNWSRFG